VKRALPILVLTIAALIPLWRFEPTASTTTVAESGSSSSSSSSDSTGQVVAGDNISTSHGNVQVEVTFSGSEITAVRMLQQPDSGPTSKAVPQLIEETLTAQSADIDTVSGATSTSEAYVNSLRSAIDSRDS
jgi:uncharacterized protein with FMN-binding domain